MRGQALGGPEGGPGHPERHGRACGHAAGGHWGPEPGIPVPCGLCTVRTWEAHATVATAHPFNVSRGHLGHRPFRNQKNPRDKSNKLRLCNSVTPRSPLRRPVLLCVAGVTAPVSPPRCHHPGVRAGLRAGGGSRDAEGGEGGGPESSSGVSARTWRPESLTPACGGSRGAWALSARVCVPRRVPQPQWRAASERHARPPPLLPPVLYFKAPTASSLASSEFGGFQATHVE